MPALAAKNALCSSRKFPLMLVSVLVNAIIPAPMAVSSSSVKIVTNNAKPCSFRLLLTEIMDMPFCSFVGWLHKQGILLNEEKQGDGPYRSGLVSSNFPSRKPRSRQLPAVRLPSTSFRPWKVRGQL